MIRTMAQQMSFDEASKLMNENPNSQLVLVPSKQHVKLSPKYIGSVKSGVSEVLKSQLLLYNRELNGVPVAFRNIKALQRLGLIIADQTCLHLDIEAEFILFKPAMGCILKGIINKVGKKHVGCLVHGCFNGWFPRSDITDTGTDTPELELMGREVEFQVLETFSSNRVVSLRGKFHSLISQPKAEKKGKKGKQTLPASKSYLDSLDDSLHIQPIMSSTQIETPSAGHEKKKKKQKKLKQDTLEFSNVSENGLDFSDSVVKFEPNTSEDVSAMLGSDDSLTRKKKKKKRKLETNEEVTVKQEALSDKHEKQKDSKKQKKKKRKSDIDKEVEIKQEAVQEVQEQRVKQKKKKKSDVGENVIVKQEIVTDDKEVQKSTEKHKKKKKRKSQEVIEEVKQEIVTDNHEVLKNNEKQTKRKNLKRKLQEEELETVQSSDDFVSPRKKVKKEKKEKHAINRDSHGPNDSNNDVSKHKKSKHKK